MPLSVPAQSLSILEMLIAKAGEIVTREEIRQRLWPDGTVVEFEHSVSSAVNRLRVALGDSATAARFIETVPRRGYRFLVPVQTEETVEAPVTRASFLRPVVGMTAAVLVCVLAAAWMWTKPTSPRFRSVAVLPLGNLSDDQAEEYFADGLTEELITRLSQTGTVQVVSRTSVMRFKGVKKSIREIAAELRVDAVVEGTVQRTEDRVRVTAQLIDAATDRHIWSRSYDRPHSDVLRLRDQIASAIAEECRVHLAVRPARPVHPEAYEAYLKGRYFAGRFTPAGQSKAVQHFEKSVALDPTFAPAWAGLAHAIGYLDYMNDKPASSRCREAMQRALDLDPLLAEAHVNFADLEFYDDWKWRSGEAAFARAVELNPGSVDALDHYAVCLRALGRYEESLRLYEKCARMDPLSPGIVTALGHAYLHCGKLQEAVATFRGAVELDRTYGPAHLGLAAVFEKLGRSQEAFDARITHLKLSERSEDNLRTLEETYRSQGLEAFKRRVAREQLTALEKRATSGSVSSRHMAQAYVAAGDYGRAIEWLEKAYAQRCPGLAWLKTGRHWDPLRNDPRFASLLQRMSLN